jgi:hypothetical protein
MFVYPTVQFLDICEIHIHLLRNPVYVLLPRSSCMQHYIEYRVLFKTCSFYHVVRFHGQKEEMSGGMKRWKMLLHLVTLSGLEPKTLSLCCTPGA